MNAHPVVPALAAFLGEGAVTVPVANRAETTVVRGDTVARVYVTSEAEVSEVLRVCGAHHVALHPVSAGKNWGYGANVPWSERPSVLLDLSRMRRIVVDEHWGKMRVQAGVTFAQAFEALEANKSSFVLSTIGGSPAASVLANALERGHGYGQFNDRFGSLRCLRVVLGDGTIVDTDDPIIDGAETHRWGRGPILRGLFSQSNFGVVVEADMLLEAKPKYFEVLTLWMFEPKKVPSLIDRFRRERFQGEIAFRSAHRIWSDGGPGWPAKTTRVGYPFRIVFSYSGNSLAELEERRKLRLKLTERLGTTQRDILTSAPKRSVGAIADVAVRADRNLRPDRPHDGSISAMYRVRDALPPATEAPRPLDMDRDRIGLLWATPVVPMDGATVAKLVRAAEEVALAQEVQPDISMISLDDWRYLDGIFGFLFDATVDGSRQRAELAFEAFSKVATELNCPSYRTGIQHSPLSMTADRRRTLARLRDALDPAHVLSPWRTEIEVSR